MSDPDSNLTRARIVAESVIAKIEAECEKHGGLAPAYSVRIATPDITNALDAAEQRGREAGRREGLEEAQRTAGALAASYRQKHGGGGDYCTALNTLSMTLAATMPDPLADANGNRHHKDGSRCADPLCRRAHALPFTPEEPTDAR